MNDTPQKSDIIFIPGTSKSAITEHAAQLYCSGYAKYVLPSGMYSTNIGRFTSLCCQSFHARRAFMSYLLHFPNVEILVVPTDTQGITKENWFSNENGYCKVMGEVSKCGKYFMDYLE